LVVERTICCFKTSFISTIFDDKRQNLSWKIVQIYDILENIVAHQWYYMGGREWDGNYLFGEIGTEVWSRWPSVNSLGCHFLSLPDLYRYLKPGATGVQTRAGIWIMVEAVWGYRATHGKMIANSFLEC
jgi:hypothetical protein